MKTRICIAQGVAQLLFLLSSLRESGEPGHDYLILRPRYGRDGTKSALKQMAAAGWSWKHVWHIDYSSHRQSTGNVVLHAKRRTDDVAEIWCCMPGGYVENQVMQSFPAAELILYEDGLLTYADLETVPQLVRHPRRLYKTISKRLYHLLGSPLQSSYFARWPMRRIERSYLILTEYLPIPSYLQRTEIVATRRASLQATANQIGDALQIPRLRQMPKNSLLFLGAAAAISKGAAWEARLQHYQECIEQILAKGYTVYWKEHPKARKSFFERLASRFGTSIRAIDGGCSWPIEVLLDGAGFSAVVGQISTSLLTTQILDGGQPYALSDLKPLTGMLKISTSYPRRIIPAVDTLPGAHQCLHLQNATSDQAEHVA